MRFILKDFNRDAHPAPRKASLALQKLKKPAGRSGEKLTVDYADYAHTWASSGEMKEELLTWSFVQLVIIWFAEM